MSRWLPLLAAGLLSCGGTGSVVEEVPSLPAGEPVGSMARGEDCPYWYMAPCGEDWWGGLTCDSCGQSYSCGNRDDAGNKVWGLAGWPCHCIDLETGDLLEDKPDCGTVP